MTDEEDLTLEEYLSEDEDDWAEDDETSEDSVSERVRKTSLPSSPQATSIVQAKAPTGASNFHEDNLETDFIFSPPLYKKLLLTAQEPRKGDRNQDTRGEHDRDGQQDELLEIRKSLQRFLEILEFG